MMLNANSKNVQVTIELPNEFSANKMCTYLNFHKFYVELTDPIAE